MKLVYAIKSIMPSNMSWMKVILTMSIWFHGESLWRGSESRILSLKCGRSLAYWHCRRNINCNQIRQQDGPAQWQWSRKLFKSGVQPWSWDTVWESPQSTWYAVQFPFVLMSRKLSPTSQMINGICWRKVSRYLARPLRLFSTWKVKNMWPSRWFS